MMQRLVLFDIDGTLLRAGGAGKRAFHEALVEVFGTTGPIAGYSFAGRTDPQITRELLRGAELPDDAIDAGLPALWASYLGRLERELEAQPAARLPGVEPLLKRIEEAGDPLLLGLLTGNVAGGARLKLESAGIGFDRFRVGAFGSDHADRPSLPAIAVERAEALVGRRYAGKEIVIIGDTPLDIACGVHLGVRTIATATGTHGMEELAGHDPDHLFEDLSDLEAVWAAIRT